jgi:hypothetical protein
MKTMHSASSLPQPLDAFCQHWSTGFGGEEGMMCDLSLNSLLMNLYSLCPKNKSFRNSKFVSKNKSLYSIWHVGLQQSISAKMTHLFCFLALFGKILTIVPLVDRFKKIDPKLSTEVE